MEGLLSQIFKNTPLANLGIQPALTQNELKIELTEHQFKQMILQGLDERGKKAVDIKIEDKKIIIVVRLF